MKNFVIGTSLLFFGLTAGAATPEDFNEKTFALAQAEEKTILLDFHQASCGTCKKQDNVINEISKTDDFKDVTFLKVNFDEQNDVNKRFQVTSKSTLVVLKGKKELGRAIGITSREDISQLVSKGVN